MNPYANKAKEYLDKFIISVYVIATLYKGFYILHKLSTDPIYSISGFINFNIFMLILLISILMMAIIGTDTNL